VAGNRTRRGNGSSGKTGNHYGHSKDTDSELHGWDPLDVFGWQENKLSSTLKS
jgi:hypothetical protein